MNTPQLNACKKCGSPAIVHEQKLSFCEEKSEFRAGCGTCSNSGPWRYDEREAVGEWNNKNKRPNGGTTALS